MLLIDKANLTKSTSTRKQFHRRKDLTETVRMQIAVNAYIANAGNPQPNIMKMSPFCCKMKFQTEPQQQKGDS